MEFNQIKNLIKKNGDKFIFLDNGEPEMVVMSFQEYEKLNGLSKSKYAGKPDLARSGSPGLADFGLEEMQETEFMVSSGLGIAGLPSRLEDVRLEDLPI